MLLAEELIVERIYFLFSYEKGKIETATNTVTGSSNVRIVYTSPPKKILRYDHHICSVSPILCIVLFFLRCILQ